MQAGFDYMLVRNHAQHRLLKIIGVPVLVLGLLSLIGGGVYYGYAVKARAGLDKLNATVPVDIVNEQAGPDNQVSANPDAGQLGAVQIPASAIAGQQLYPGGSIPASAWSNPLMYEPPSQVKQSLLQQFTPISIDQALPVGSQSAPTRIMVPAIGVDASVTSLEILDLGDSRAYATPKRTVGHIPQSANPGEAGSSWFFGHLESPIMSEGAVFQDLPAIPALLRQGEDVYIIADNGAHQYLYKIASTQVVHQKDMRLYDSGQATIHLVACVPSLVYDQRLIVTGQLVGIR